MSERPHLYVLNESGEPQPCEDLRLWGHWFEGAQRVLRQTDARPGVVVSTVFLGTDHNFSGDGPALLWETMVFGGALDETQERHASRAEPIAAHERLVAEAQR